MGFDRKSEKYLSAKESLDKSLHAIYDHLVEEQLCHTEKRYERGCVAYNVLADLIKDG